MSAIQFDASTRQFVLQLKSSFYAFHLTEDGQLLHLGSGALPARTPARFTDPQAYEDPSYIWAAQGRRYEYPTFGDINYQHVAMKASFPAPTQAIKSGDGNAANLPVRDLRLRYVKHDISTTAQPALVAQHPHKPRKSSVTRETLVVSMKDIAYDLHVKLFYRVTPEHDVIERWIEIDNRTGQIVTLDALAFAAVHFPNHRYELTHAAGTWAREFVPVKRAIEQGQTVLSQMGLNTGHAHNPFYLLNVRDQASENHGEVFFGALAYSGNWSLCFDALPTNAVRLFAGYETSDFQMTLQSGQSHVTPAIVMGVSDEGYGGASRRLHAFARDYILPAISPGRDRPVLYNSWEATYFDMTVQNQSQLAHAAAAMGVELFCMDDGWFGARRNDRAGLGDWTVSRDLFPDGLKPLIDEVLRLGMRFGLWVEPEMVNPDSDLYRAHPDWVLHYPGRPRTEMRNQLILDFGRKEVREHIFSVLDALLREYAITFFKWDMNRYATEPGSVAGRDLWHRHVAGLYEIMDRLKTAHPQLDIQSCSGGGGRIDLGILQRADQAWTSDNTDAYDRVYIQDGFSLAYPLRAMESWVTHQHNHQTGREASTDLRFDVAMRGTLGIGSNIDKLSTEETAAYARKIAFYKKIRPVIQNGHLYRLATVQQGGASIWQIVSDDAKTCVYSSVVIHQLQGYHLPLARLRGLNPQATYRVVDEHDKEIGRYTAAQLMGIGMPGDTRFGGLNCSVRSRTLLLEQVSG